MPRGRPENLIQNNGGTSEKARENGRKGGLASGRARREKADLRRMMEIALDTNIPGKDMTHAQRLIQSTLHIAENPKNGASAIRAFETILHMIGQDVPEQKTDALDILAEILKENRKNAELQADTETE